MNTFTLYLGRGVAAEALKIKNTWAFRLGLLAPLSVVSMTFLVFFFKGEFLLKSGAPAWGTWAINNLMASAQFLVPLYVALITALVNGLEHQSMGWKQVYALPVPKALVFLNKYLLQLGLVMLSFFTFWVSMLAFGALLHALRPELGFGWEVPVGDLLVAAFRVLVGTLFVFTLQFCLSYRVKSTALSIGIGILFTLAFLITSRWEHIGYYPYSWPYFSAMAYFTKQSALFVPQMWYSVSGTLVLLGLGTWYSTKRQVQ